MYTSSNDSEIYIGQKAGKDLYNTLAKAKKSIKVISPYLTASLVSELVRLQKEGVDVMLITSDSIEDYKPNQKKESILYEVVTQVRKTNKAQKAKKTMMQTTVMILQILAALFVIGTIVAFLFYKASSAQYYIIGGAGSVISFLGSQLIKSNIKGMRIYRYNYDTVFPIKVYYSPYNKEIEHSNKFFIHSKVYIIDGKVAFLGSLNFTRSGLTNNYETSIKVRDRKAVHEISKEYDRLFYTDELQGVDFNLVGKKIYKERKN